MILTTDMHSEGILDVDDVVILNKHTIEYPKLEDVMVFVPEFFREIADVAIISEANVDLSSRIVRAQVGMNRTKETGLAVPNGKFRLGFEGGANGVEGLGVCDNDDVSRHGCKRLLSAIEHAELFGRQQKSSC